MPTRQVTRDADRIFQPQVRNIQQQLGGVSAQFDPQREAIRQARVNAFRDVDTGAQGRGMFFSGAPIQERGRLEDERFTPAFAQIAGQEAQRRGDLTQQLQQIQAQRGVHILDRLDALRAAAQQQQLERERLAQQRRLSQAQINAMLQQARL